MKQVEVVCAIIKNKDNLYFCCQRPLTKVLGGKWEFPGGKIETEETHEQTIKREIKEELNADVIVLKYLTSNYHEYHNLEKPFAVTLHAYICSLKSDHLELLEHINSKWVAKEELLNLDFAEADIVILNELLKEE